MFTKTRCSKLVTFHKVSMLFQVFWFCMLPVITSRGLRREEDDALEVPGWCLGLWDKWVFSSFSFDSPNCDSSINCLFQIHNNGRVQSSANGNPSLGIQRAREVFKEAENIYNAKCSSSNRLGTSIKLNPIGKGNFFSDNST